MRVPETREGAMFVRLVRRVQRGRPVVRGEDGADDGGCVSLADAADAIFGIVAGSRSPAIASRDDDGARPSEPPRAFL